MLGKLPQLRHRLIGVTNNYMHVEYRHGHQALILGRAEVRLLLPRYISPTVVRISHPIQYAES